MAVTLSTVPAGDTNWAGSVNSNFTQIETALNSGGAGPTLPWWQNLPVMGGNTVNAVSLKSISFNTVSIFPLTPDAAFPGNMTVSTAMLNLSISGSTATLATSHTSSFMLGIYTRNTTNSLRLSLLNSVMATVGFGNNNSNSTAWQGQRFLTIHSSLWSSSPAFTFGEQYYGALLVRSSNRVAQTASVYGGFHLLTSGGRWGTVGVSASTSNSNIGPEPFLGFYKTSTTALPGSIHVTDVNYTSNSANFVPHVLFNNLTSSL